MNPKILKFLDNLSDIIFPDGFSCIICDKEIIPNRYGTCNECEIIRNDNKYCLKCGTSLYTAADYCLDCPITEYSFDRARSALIYNDSLHSILYRLKYGGAKWSAKYLAAYMADAYIKMNLDADVLIPVPLFAAKYKNRGYNQSEELSRHLSGFLGIPADNTVLIKIRDTADQASLSRKERAENIKDAFEVNTAGLKGKKVMIIDDVITTAATINECARMLRKLRPESITAFSLAAPKKSLD